jgi:hypothetical protein
MTMDATGEIEAAAAAVGHRSTKSTEQYLVRRKRGAKVLQGIENVLSGTLSQFQVTKKGVIRQNRQKWCNGQM